jgi:hypothetical protein
MAATTTAATSAVATQYQTGSGIVATTAAVVEYRAPVDKEPVGKCLLERAGHSGAAKPLLEATADSCIALYFTCHPAPHDDEDAVLLAIGARPRH